MAKSTVGKFSGRSAVVLSAGAMLLASSFWAAPVKAADATAPASAQAPASSAPSAPLAYIKLEALFAEGVYVKLDQKNTAHPGSAHTYGVRAGAVYSLPRAGILMVPSITLAKTHTEGSNPFATIDSDARIKGGALKLISPISPGFFGYVGIGGGVGNQDLVFNVVVPSNTTLHNYWAYIGANKIVYVAQNFDVRVSDQFAYRYTNAEFDPTNTPASGIFHTLSNTVGVTGAWHVTSETRLSTKVSWTSLFATHEMIGEVSPDRNFATVSLGASQKISRSLSLYGSIGRRLFDSKRDVTSAKIGVMARF